MDDTIDPTLRRPYAIGAFVAIGLVQGLAAWGLHLAIRHHTWPQTSPAWLGALVYLTVVAPLVAYLSEDGFASLGPRVGFVALLSTVLALLGAHAGHTATVLPDFHQPLAAAVSAFVAVALAAGFDPSRWRFDYPRLFEAAWRNAVLLPVAAALTGIFWVLLWAGAWLMNTIGIHALRDLLEEAGFIYVATGMAFGLAIGLALARSRMLVVFRRFWLSLTRWFLPLAVAFAVCWLAALPFTGVERLLDTHSTALLLFWFGALSITFVNAAFEDGRRGPPFPRLLALPIAWGWLVLPLLALIGDWALWLRVAEHGWTAGRIWAAVVGLLVTVHAIGYALSLAARGGWMGTLPATNIVAAIIEVLAILALLSPVADARRLAVTSQVARLRAGAVAPEAFDWKALRWTTGVYGMDALESLAASRQGPIARLATEALQDKNRWDSRPQTQDTAVALAALRDRIETLPAGTRADPDLLRWLSRTNADWDERQCVSAPERCKLWIRDLDGDGAADAVLLWDTGTHAQLMLYARTADGWRRQGGLHGGTRSLADWTAAICQGHVDLRKPRWPDLVVDGTTMTFGSP